jgi:hypothetical protein
VDWVVNPPPSANLWGTEGGSESSPALRRNELAKADIRAATARVAARNSEALGVEEERMMSIVDSRADLESSGAAAGAGREGCFTGMSRGSGFGGVRPCVGG